MYEWRVSFHIGRECSWGGIVAATAAHAEQEGRRRYAEWRKNHPNDPEHPTCTVTMVGPMPAQHSSDLHADAHSGQNEPE
jgi:hypothetical protein